MDSERVQKPSKQQQSGGFSPSKLRAILLGIEKKQKEEEELESGYALRSETDVIEDRGADAPESCIIVDMVSSPPESSTRVGVQEDSSFESDTVSLSVFEFHKTTERVQHRLPLVPPFSKPAPSKWDDAEKWIASPNRSSKGGGGGVVQAKRLGKGSYGGRSFGAKIVLEVTDEADTKRIDPTQDKMDGVQQKAVSWVSEPLTAVAGDKSSMVFENPFADSAISLSEHDPATSVQSALTLVEPPSTVKSVSMRDMGTEMTPTASQKASRTGTPNRSSTPVWSPNSSRPLSPARIAPASRASESAEHLGDPDKNELSGKDLKMKTRREIRVLGEQLGKMSIAAWASKEEECDETVSVGHPSKSLNEARAAAWEDAEKAKYLARFKHKEIKIQAWENHQKAKTDAEMRKIEVEVERMRARANEKLMKQLATARHKAEEKRAAAEAKKNQQATRTARQAEYIRQTGHIPTSVSCWGWCP